MFSACPAQKSKWPQEGCTHWVFLSFSTCPQTTLGIISTPDSGPLLQAAFRSWWLLGGAFRWQDAQIFGASDLQHSVHVPELLSMKTLRFLQILSHLVAQLFLPGNVGLSVMHPHQAEEEPLLMYTEGLFCLAIIVSPSSAL